MKLKKNDKLTLTILDLNNLGFGVGKHDGFTIFVADTVMGDIAEVVLIKVNKTFAIGKALRILVPSAERTSDRCEGRACRACAYRMISYEKEKELKHASVLTAFKKAGLSDITAAPLISADKPTAYRNKAQYPIEKTSSGEYKIGFFAPKSHRVTEAADCPLAPPIFSEILECLRSFFKKHDFSVYDETTGSGLLRHVYLRRGDVSGEILLVLVINGTSIPASDALIQTVTKHFPDVVGILLNVNTEDTNVILGDDYIPLYGKNSILDTLAGVELEISAPAFYQVNHETAELLYDEAKRLAALSGKETVLDLFCGTGSIGLSLAHQCSEVIGIEIVESAVECAKRNAARAGIKNASFYAADASDTDQILSKAEAVRGKKILPDVIILDPPRKGCTEKLLSFVASLSPKRIVYVSCNPDTLARDCAILGKSGYQTGVVTPVDMFPGTGHVESVVCLTRK